MYFCLSNTKSVSWVQIFKSRKLWHSITVSSFCMSLVQRMSFQIATCRSTEEGSALAWPNMTWSLNGEVEWVLRERAEVCANKKRSIVVFSDRFSLEAAINLCQVRTNSRNFFLFVGY